MSMPGYGCAMCPVKNICNSISYRGSSCSALRSKRGLGDPLTVADKLDAMTIHEKAAFISTHFSCAEDRVAIEKILSHLWCE